MKSPRFTASPPRASLLLVASILVVTAAEPEMVFIPGGDFLRGRSHPLPDDNLKWFPTLLKDDRPVRSIVLDPFYIDKHEVTNAQYAEFLKDTGGAPPYYWPQGKAGERQRKASDRKHNLAGRQCLLPMGRKAPPRRSGMGNGHPAVCVTA